MERSLANIRINALPSEASPVKTEVVAIDGATTRKATIEAIVLVGRPTASQAEAEAGTEPVKAMTPLTTAQAIAAQGSVQFASAAQGAKADSAVQPARAVNTGTGLTGGGNLSADRTIALNAGSIASLALADSSVQPARTITAGTGLTGGGDLSANRSLALSSTSLTSLGLADTSVQPTNTSTAAFQFVLDEDDMVSNSATKVPTQQSVKAYVDGGRRERLSANRTYYVRPDGSDSNNGLANTAGGAFLTLNGAKTAIVALDLNGFAVTVQIADGTYTTGVTFDGMPPGQTSNQQIIYKGNTGTPGNVIISTTSANCFRARNGARITVQDMEVRTTTSQSCLLATDGGQITFGNMRFGTAAGPHVEVSQHGRAYNAGNYSIVGGAVSHLHVTNNGYVLLFGATVTITGTPAFSAYFVGSAIVGGVQIAGTTFSGSATGQRYFVHKNSVVDTGGLTLPGSVAGATATGGQYI